MASMGPQPFGCGKREEVKVVVRTMAASMGPQPFGCGKGSNPEVDHMRKNMLQWGHSLLAVERAKEIWFIKRVKKMLQWGHSLLAVERGRR